MANRENVKLARLRQQVNLSNASSDFDKLYTVMLGRDQSSLDIHSI